MAVLFGDGAAAVVVQASDREEGVMGSVLGCDAEARQALRVRGMGCTYAGTGGVYGDTIWDFDGPSIFKRAVKGMTEACAHVMRQAGVSGDQIDLVIPHQANLRIIEAVAKYAGIPMDRVIVTVQKCANMSAATVPVGLVEALKEGRLRPGALLLMPDSAADSPSARCWCDGETASHPWARHRWRFRHAIDPPSRSSRRFAPHRNDTGVRRPG